MNTPEPTVTLTPSSRVNRLVTRDGKPIVATLEVIYGRCFFTDVSRNEQGQIVFEYDGDGTEMNWDSQAQCRDSAGRRIFLDEDGGEHTEDTLNIVPNP